MTNGAGIMQTLWDYQHAPIQEIRSRLADGFRSPLLVMPTGAGKGTCATYIIENAIRKNSHAKILFLINRILLAQDMSDRLDRLGIAHGVIMGSDPRHRPWLNVHVASIDTLHRRRNLPAADIIFVDEAHHAVSQVWKKVLDRYPTAAVIGMTATPCRLDGRGLGHVFDSLVMGPSVSELIAVNASKGHEGVVPIRTYAPASPDLSGVQSGRGDYNQKQLAAACNKRKLVGDMVEHWLKLGRGCPTIGWAVDIAHSKACMEEFRAAGIRAAHMDHSMPATDRHRMLDALRRYEIEVVWSIGVLGYGVDIREVSCGISACPTQSLSKHLQQIGRIARAQPDKHFAILLDHAGNTALHGLFDDPREWTLEDGYVTPGGKSDGDGPSVRMCKACFLAFPATQDRCPECGWVYVAKGRAIGTVAGDLQEVQPERWYKCQGCGHRGRLLDVMDYTSPCPRCECGPLTRLATKYDAGKDEDARKQQYMAWFQTGLERGYKTTWAAMRYQSIYKKWPPGAWKAEAELAASMSMELVGAGSQGAAEL